MLLIISLRWWWKVDLSKGGNLDLFVVFICKKAVVYPRACFIPAKHSQSCLNVTASGIPRVQTEQRFQFDFVAQESFHQPWHTIPRIHQEEALPSPLPLALIFRKGGTWWLSESRCLLANVKLSGQDQLEFRGGYFQSCALFKEFESSLIFLNIPAPSFSQYHLETQERLKEGVLFFSLTALEVCVDGQILGERSFIFSHFLFTSYNFFWEKTI